MAYTVIYANDIGGRWSHKRINRNLTHSSCCVITIWKLTHMATFNKLFASVPQMCKIQCLNWRSNMRSPQNKIWKFWLHTLAAHFVCASICKISNISRTRTFNGLFRTSIVKTISAKTTRCPTHCCLQLQFFKYIIRFENIICSSAWLYIQRITLDSEKKWINYVVFELRRHPSSPYIDL